MVLIENIELLDARDDIYIEASNAEVDIDL